MFNRNIILIGFQFIFSCYYSQSKSYSETITSFSIVVNYPKFTVRTQILKESPSIKIKPELTYFWYTNGKIIETTGSFDGHILNGFYKKFNLNENIMESGTFVNGLKDGSWTCWNDSGKIIEIVSWKSGLKNGVFILNNEKGERIAEGFYKKGLLNGKFSTYSNKKVSSIVEYKDGEILPSKVENEIKANKNNKKWWQLKKKKGNTNNEKGDVEMEKKNKKIKAKNQKENKTV